MLVFVRAITYATLFIGFVLVTLPARTLSWAEVPAPTRWRAFQLAGMVVGAAGATLVIWCVVAFAHIGRGTPAPFDPPQGLVVGGPYGYVRNPMYLGAVLVLTGAACFYEAAVLWVYAGAFLALMHLIVVLYEEPALKQTFGDEYQTYCGHVRRWWPRPSRA